MNVLAEAHQNNWLATGLIYIETDKPSLTEVYNLVMRPSTAWKNRTCGLLPI